MEQQPRGSASPAVHCLRRWGITEPQFSHAAKAIRQREWKGALLVVPRGARLGLFTDWWEEGCLTTEEFRRELPAVWSDAEPNDAAPKWLRLWREAADLGGRVEQEPLPAGDPLTVFRGEETVPARKTRGISWALNRDVAIFFALRYAVLRDGTGVVLEGIVPRHAILGYIPSRSEAEVIVRTKLLEVVGMTVVTEADRPQAS